MYSHRWHKPGIMSVSAQDLMSSNKPSPFRQDAGRVGKEKREEALHTGKLGICL